MSTTETIPEPSEATPESKGIPFTQYLLPDGRKRAIWMKCEKAIEDMAAKIIGLGYRLEAEILTTSEISLTVFCLESEEDICIEICANGPPVPIAVEKLVKDAFKLLYKEAGIT